MISTQPVREPIRERFISRFQPVHTISPNGSAFKTLFRSLRIWFTNTWLDWLFLICAGASAAAVWIIPVSHNRLFPVTFYQGSGDIVWPDISFPYTPDIFDSTTAGILCAVIPIASMLIAQIWVRSFLDFANGCLGLVYALVTGTLFQVVLKKVIGGLRPHFLAVCKPVLPQDTSIGQGFQHLMFNVDDVCTGEDKGKIDNALQSFPSGHSNIAWAGLGFLTIYLFTHLGIRNISRRRPSFWRMLMVVAPMFMATYICSSVVLGYHHHGYDVIFGALIGMTMALFGYRMVFASILDPRWNTVPLVRDATEEKMDEEKANGSTIDAHEGGQRIRDSEETRIGRQSRSPMPRTADGVLPQYHTG